MTTNMHKAEIADITLDYVDIDGNPAAVVDFTAVLTPEGGELVIDNVTGTQVVLHFNPSIDGKFSIETHADGDIGQGVIDIPLTLDFDVSEDAANVSVNVVVRPE